MSDRKKFLLLSVFGLLFFGSVRASITAPTSITVDFNTATDVDDFLTLRDDAPDGADLAIAQNAAKGAGATASGGLEAVNVGTLNTQNDLAALYAPGGVAANGAISLSAGETLTMSMKFKVLDNTEAATPRLGIASFSDAAAATTNWSVLDINQGKDMIGHNAYADGIAINVATAGDKTFNIVNSINGTGRTLIPDPSGPYTLVDGEWYQYVLEITKSATVGDFDVAITLNALNADGMALVSQVGSLSQTITNAGLYADGDVIAGLTIVHDGDPDTVSDEYDDLLITVESTLVDPDPFVSNPTPGDVAEHVNPTTAMSWDVQNASSPSFDINIGTDLNCNDILTAHNTGSVQNYIPSVGLLDYATQYFWRVDVTDNSVEYTGTVWSFTTGGKATDPIPANGGIADRSAGVLSWSGDTTIASYDVWFGTPGNLLSAGHYTVTSVSFGDLASAIGQSVITEGNYQWRVDTKDAGGGLMVIGDVWDVSFLEVTPVVIDDFEGYADTAALLGNWTPLGGASLAFEDAYNTMQIDYSGASYATLELSPAQSWDAGGMDTFVISLRGNDTNDAATVSLTISDGSASATVMCPYADITTSPWWRQWYVRLSDFSDSGVSLNVVTSVQISISGGSGTVHVDDLRLELPGCIAAFQPAGDLNKDCRINMTDLGMLAEDWLLKDFGIDATVPNAGLMLAHFPFDEISGASLASDTSGNGHHAVVSADDLGVIWDTSGYNGGCIVFDGSVNVAIPAAVFSGVTDAVTVAMWVYGEVSDYPDNVNEASFAAGPVSGDEYSWSRAVWEIDSSDDYGGQWNHYAAVKNTVAGTMRLYHNGVLVSQTLSAADSMDGASAGETVMSMARLDARTTSTVKIDDLRIYSDALSQAEIAHLAGGSIIQPIEPIYTESDLSGDGKISLPDFAVIARQWLQQK